MTDVAYPSYWGAVQVRQPQALGLGVWGIRKWDASDLKSGEQCCTFEYGSVRGTCCPAEVQWAASQNAAQHDSELYADRPF